MTVLFHQERAMMEDRQGRGLRLIDVVVVVSLFGLVATVLLPALQQGICVQRNTECHNNLHNLAIALDSYRNGAKLPVAYREGQDLTWVKLLLKDLERPDIDQALKDPETAQSAREAVISSLQCPHDPWNWDQPAGISYAANLGYIHKSEFYSRDSRSAGPLQEKWSEEMIRASRVLSSFPTTKNGILNGDGLAQTIFFMENARPRAWYKQTNADVGVGMSFEFGPDLTSLAIGKGVIPDPASFPTSLHHWGFAPKPRALPRPTSPHQRCINALMGDGSVKSLNLNIDWDVYARLLTPDGYRFGQSLVTGDF